MKSIKKIKKAIIPAAGLGTRFLPITKKVAKEMLPIVDKPTIEYIVDEAIKSGIEQILIIISKDKGALIDYFSKCLSLESNLKRTNKMKLKEKLYELPKNVQIFCALQDEPLGLGHAISLAEPFVGDEPFAVLLGDDVVINNEKNKPALLQCIEAYNNYDCSIVGVQKIPKKDLHKYGVVEPMVKNKFIDSKKTIMQAKSFIEKPTTKIPSDFAILGRYILKATIFDEIRQNGIGYGNEIDLTTSLVSLAKKEKVLAKCFDGTRYDIGNKIG